MTGVWRDRPLWIALALAAATLTVAGPEAAAQTPAPTTSEEPLYLVTYVEVMPTSAEAVPPILRRYRQATAAVPGNRRCEIVQRIGEPNQFAILEVWRDRAAAEAHARTPTWAEAREKIAAIRNAPTDERVHTALTVGPVEGTPPRGAIYVVTHVDVIPPRKDDGIAAVRRLGEESRQHTGNVRFEVVQQTNRPNHFTVVEVWRDPVAVGAHSLAPATRQFRDALAPMTGALYDERKYRAVE